MSHEAVVGHIPITTGLKPEGAFACLLPWFAASLFEGNPEVSWWIAWAGSWFIIALVFLGRVFELPRDRPMLDQVMRPWFLMHLVFAGYNFLSAIFFWFDVNGITFGLGDPIMDSSSSPEVAAQVQRLYVLAHAGLAIGMGAIRQLPKRQRVQPNRSSFTPVLLVVAMASVVLAFLLKFVAGLGQVEVKMQGIFAVAAAVSLGVAYHERSRWFSVTVAVNVVLFVLALASGWKSGPIVMVILIAAAFYPKSPKRTLILAGLAFAGATITLPTLSNSIRANAWRGEMTRMEALDFAVSDLEGKTRQEIAQDTWSFLAGRLSEAALFTKYIELVPEAYPYYEFDLLGQAAMSVVPRILWPEKVNLEELVNERVFKFDIIQPGSDVSAKPQFVVDGYLSYGAIGVFVAMLVFGAVAQLASNFCTSWLGGYLLGGVAFNGLFAILWQGSAFEYVLNAVVWSFVLVMVLSVIGVSYGVLRK